MSWLYVSIIAYLLLAIANLGDKLVVSKYLSSPRVYVISVALLQSMVIFLLPFFWNWPGWQNMLLNFMAGGSFVIAIYYFYCALKNGEISRVVPVVDGLVPIVVLILSSLILCENFSQRQLLAVIFLIVGGFVLSCKGWERRGSSVSIMEAELPRQNLKYIIIAVAAFAVSQIFAKITYNNQPFLSAFIWARAGGLLAVVPFLFLAGARKELKNNFGHKEKASSSKAVAFTQASGGAGFFLQSYAIKLGNVGIVVAMQGIKYFFLFVLIALLSKKFVHLKEDWNRNALIKKVCGAGLIIFGLMMLAV
ncbi:MAG: EamA family transporter [bacterium]